MSSPPRNRMSPFSSPTRSNRPAPPPGFLVPPKPNATPVAKMTIRQLHDQHARNARILSEPIASTSSYAQRMAAEQAAIESRLVELEGVQGIQEKLENTKIEDDDAMKVDSAPPLQEYRAIDAKRRALAKYAAHIPVRIATAEGFTLQEAIRIEQEAHAQDRRRRQELEEKRRRRGQIQDGEILTREERDARMWAFINYKPTDSDLEDDDDDEDEEDDDPSTWFVDDQDDGRKGQDIVEPDEEDYSGIIRIDHSRIPWAIPREE